MTERGSAATPGSRVPHVRGLLALAAGLALAPVGHARSEPPRLDDLRVSNGARPFAGDRALLTTVSPNGDGFRDRAIVTFRLTKAARVRLDVVATAMVSAGRG